MSTATFVFEMQFVGYWHAGTGEAGPGDLDAVVLRDECRVPFFQGKGIKGLFHEAFCEMIAGGGEDAPTESDLVQLFGSPGNQSTSRQGCLRFSNASLPKAEHAAIVAAKCQDALTQAIASTALEDGIAVNRTLRRIEVSIPMTLGFEVTLHGKGVEASASERIAQWLKQAAARIRMAGAHRHNGLGECHVRATREQAAIASESEGTKSNATIHEANGLIRLPFALETLEAVVLSENAATIGAHESLDFLTGAALLGAFARDHYQEVSRLGGNAAFQVFHSGHVRFGDAHPVSDTGHVAYRVPASWHYEKGAKIFDALPNQPQSLVTATVTDLARVERGEGEPLKQARGQWLAGNATKLDVRRRQHLKSARDSSAFGRPAENQLFAYQSIEKGQRFAGEIQVLPWEEADCQKVIDMLAKWIASRPKITVGRSRSAEFGLCRLEPAAAPLPGPSTAPTETGILLYALTDLSPSGTEILPADGGEWHSCLTGWKVDLAHTHVCSREYTRWNGYRGCPDPAVRVISRGSVIVLTAPPGPKPDPAAIQMELDRDGIGCHLQHGLGRVLVNPDFQSFATAAAPATLPSRKAVDTAVENASVESPLVALAKLRQSRFTLESLADGIAEKLHAKWRKFAPQPSASQWSRLRHLAGQSRDFEDFLGRSTKVFDHGASRRVWERAVSGSRPLLAEFLVDLPPLVKKIAEENEDAQATDLPAPSIAPELMALAKQPSPPDGERLVLLAVAEACRRLRQLKSKEKH